MVFAVAETVAAVVAEAVVGGVVELVRDDVVLEIEVGVIVAVGDGDGAAAVAVAAAFVEEQQIDSSIVDKYQRDRQDENKD